MQTRFPAFLTVLLLAAPFTSAYAEDDRFQETIDIFRNAGESGRFFDISYAYAVFPAVGRAGVGIGGARGTGRVFRDGGHVGDTT